MRTLSVNKSAQPHLMMRPLTLCPSELPPLSRTDSSLAHPLIYSMLANRIRIHLVHGTWAKGHFGASKAWTEAGHDVYERLRTLLPISTVIETFLWSGKNSVSAREQAAKELRAHLTNSLEKFPNDRHIVVAHSHGGTISNLAIADPKIDGRIERLRPFAIERVALL